MPSQFDQMTNEFCILLMCCRTFRGLPILKWVWGFYYAHDMCVNFDQQFWPGIFQYVKMMNDDGNRCSWGNNMPVYKFNIEAYLNTNVTYPNKLT